MSDKDVSAPTDLVTLDQVQEAQFGKLARQFTEAVSFNDIKSEKI